MYVTIFNESPFFEDWNKKSALKELNYQINNLEFSGLLETQIGGFCFGYSLPEKNSSRVDYELINSILQEKGFGFANTFYVSEVGVIPNKQNKGLGTKLLNGLTNLISDYDLVVFRTKNPLMVRIGEKVFGKPFFSEVEESSYEGGRIYGFKQN